MVIVVSALPSVMISAVVSGMISATFVAVPGLSVVMAVEVVSVVGSAVLATVRQVAVVAIARVVVVIDVTMPVMASVVPRSGADEDAIVEPFRAIVPVGRAVVWRVIVVTIRAYRRLTDADTEGNLRLRGLTRGEETAKGCDCR